MKKMNPLKTIAAILLVSVITSYGCILNPDTGDDDRDPIVIEWPDLTTPNDVVETIRLVYKHFNTASTDELMTHYSAILYDDPDQNHDYVWNMQTEDVAEYGDVLLREDDIKGTRYLIEQSSALQLTIEAGSWLGAPDVCEECLVTTRTYWISTTLDHKGEIMKLAGEEMRIQLIIGPNEEFPGTWTIYVASDLKKAGT